MFDEIINRKGTSCFKWDTRPDVDELPNDIIPMWVADMDFRSPDEVINAIIDRAKHGILGYTFPPDEYFESITEWWKKRHGIRVKKEWIVPTPGVVPGIAIALDVFTEKEDSVIVQSPVYWPFYDVIESNEREVIVNQLVEEDGRYRMDLSGLAEKTSDAKAIIICNPHNPVGRVWSEEELTELADVLKDEDILIISDEIHMDFVFSKSFNSFLKMDEVVDKLIVLSSPGKTFNIPALQNGYAIIPNESIRKRLEERLRALHIDRPHLFSIVATIAAYKNGERWLDDLLKYIEGNFKLVKKELDGFKGVRVNVPEGTYLMWIDFRESPLRDPFEDLLKAGVWLQDGKVFGPGGEGFLRMNVATPKRLLIEAIRRIKRKLESPYD